MSRIWILDSIVGDYWLLELPGALTISSINFLFHFRFCKLRDRLCSYLLCTFLLINEEYLLSAISSQFSYFWICFQAIFNSYSAFVSVSTYMCMFMCKWNQKEPRKRKKMRPVQMTIKNFDITNLII